MQINILLIIYYFLFFQNLFSTNNKLKPLHLDIFENVFKYAFNKNTSINTLQKNYYNFSLISKPYNKKTKDFWNTNWFNIMEDVCDQHRFERLYFAGIFYHINDNIKQYFEKHLFIYKTLLYFSTHHIYTYPPDPHFFNTLDPNFTMFGPNYQMSLLECCIKACYYPVSNKTELCINLIQRGAQYDIWMYHGINEGEETVFVDDVNTIKAESEDPYGPFLLSEFIARNSRCNEQLAEEIVKKGTCAQDIFIKRFPNLKIYSKEQNIPKPPIPENFINNHHFSQIRYLQIVFKGIFIPYYLNDQISLIKESLAYKAVTKRLKQSDTFQEKLEEGGSTQNIFYYFQNTARGSFIQQILTKITLYNWRPKDYLDEKNNLIKKFQKQYEYSNQDSENKNAYEYFNKFTQSTKISMNHNTIEWLTEIFGANNVHFNQNSILIRGDFMNGVIDLNHYLFIEHPNTEQLPQDPELPGDTPNKNFNKVHTIAKKIFFSILLVGASILILIKLTNLCKSI